MFCLPSVLHVLSPTEEEKLKVVEEVDEALEENFATLEKARGSKQSAKDAAAAVNGGKQNGEAETKTEKTDEIVENNVEMETEGAEAAAVFDKPAKGSEKAESAKETTVASETTAKDDPMKADEPVDDAMEVDGGAVSTAAAAATDSAAGDGRLERTTPDAPEAEKTATGESAKTAEDAEMTETESAAAAEGDRPNGDSTDCRPKDDSAKATAATEGDRPNGDSTDCRPKDDSASAAATEGDRPNGDSTDCRPKDSASDGDKDAGVESSKAVASKSVPGESAEKASADTPAEKASGDAVAEKPSNDAPAKKVSDEAVDKKASEAVSDEKASGPAATESAEKKVNGKPGGKAKRRREAVQISDVELAASCGSLPTHITASPTCHSALTNYLLVPGDP